jgi:hypothetical protein
VLSGKEGREIHAFHARELGARMPVGVIPAGNVDGDASADPWLVLERNDAKKLGHVELWSGAARSAARVASDAALAWNYFRRAFGDLNGDGSVDYTMSAAELVTVRSGTDDRALWSAPVTDVVVLADDVDGDGRRDVLCADPRRGIAEGAVELRSGATGARILWTADGAGRFWYFGSMIDLVGDLDGDGVRDWIVGGPNHRSHEHGVASLRSGRTGAELASFERSELRITISGSLFASPRKR